MKSVFRVFLLAVLLEAFCLAQNLNEFRKKVTEFTLPNGMHFIVVERHSTPVISFYLQANAGSVNDPPGRAGLAHMFEHIAYKGTPAMGTQTWTEERKALDALDEAETALELERNKGDAANRDRIDSLAAQVRAAASRADLYAASGEYPRVLDENGATGLSAATAVETSGYSYTLPANKLELWFFMESERLRQPVFREFYKELAALRDERVRQVDNNPQAKLQEAFLQTAFSVHPYGKPPLGTPTDLDRLSVRDARKFFETYYTPANLVACLVGDVNPADVRTFAQKYFGPLLAKPAPPKISIAEPPQDAPRRARVDSMNQPLVLIGYKRPNATHPDDLVFDVLSLLLGRGKTGLLEKDLVQTKKMALAAPNVPTFPAGDYPNLFATLLVIAPGSTVEENEKAFADVIEGLRTKPIDIATLERIRTKARSGLIRRIETNSGLAGLLPLFHEQYGTWERLFTALDDLDKVTPDDIMRVARQYFVDNNKVVAVLGPEPQGGSR